MWLQDRGFPPSILPSRWVRPDRYSVSISVRIRWEAHGSFKASSGLGIREGLELLGSLSFQIDASGALSGNFAASGRSPIQVVGQVSGRSVNLSADLGSGQYLFGSGTVQSAANGCPMIAGGPLAVESAPGANSTEQLGSWFYAAK